MSPNLIFTIWTPFFFSECNHSFYFLYIFTVSVDIARDWDLLLHVCALYKCNNTDSKCAFMTSFSFLDIMLREIYLSLDGRIIHSCLFISLFNSLRSVFFYTISPKLFFSRLPMTSVKVRQFLVSICRPSTLPASFTFPPSPAYSSCLQMGP